MENIIKQRFLDHLEVAQAVMDSEILGLRPSQGRLKRRWRKATRCYFVAMAAALRIASIWRRNSWGAFKRSAGACPPSP